MNFLDEALRYAEEGFSVFPLAAMEKIPPRGHHGQNEATRDADVICSWAAKNRRYNIGVATGRKFGLFVVDVDKQHGGFESMAALVRKHGLLPISRRASTPSGGLHLWFRFPETDVDIGNSDGRVGKGIDIKANRGAITAPPSVVSRGRYAWLPQYGNRLAAPPRWLVELSKPLPVPECGPVKPVVCKSNYTQKILDEELAKVLSSVNGCRNSTLNSSAWCIGKLVRSGAIADLEARAALIAAASQIGLPRAEAMQTINSAFRRAPAKQAIANNM